MGLNLPDFLQYVVRPTLRFLDPAIPYSLAAERLLLGTAIHESGLQYLDQTAAGPGPALGLFQMEGPTHLDIWTNFLAFRPALAEKIRALRAEHPSGLEQLRTNMAYACAMARTLYFRSPAILPDADNLQALAALAKRVFNGPGKATVDDYFRALRQTEQLYT